MTSVPPPSFEHPGSPPPRPELPEGVERPSVPPPGAPGQRGRTTPIWYPLVAMIAAFVGASVAVSMLAVVSGEELDGSLPQGITLGATLVQDLLLIGAALLGVHLFERRLDPESFGLRATPFWPAVGWAAVVVAGFWLVNLAILLIFGEPEQQDLVDDLKSEDSLATLIGFGALITVVAPVAEEFFFRGFMFRVFAARMGVAWAAILDGAIFGLIHWPGGPFESVIVLFALGVGFCWLCWKTGSLLPALALHAINNSVSFGATLSLDWWLFAALLVGSTGLVVWLGLLVARRRPRTAAA